MEPELKRRPTVEDKLMFRRKTHAKLTS